MEETFEFYTKNGLKVTIDRSVLFTNFECQSPDGSTCFLSVADLTWHAKKSGNTHYTYARLPDGSTILLHRLVFEGPAESEVIDHVNGNGLDNRQSNLRSATVKQNAQNQRKTARPTTSRYKGVYAPPGRRAQAYIHSNGRKIHLGTFDSQKTAAREYDKAALAEFGEFASVNFKSSKDAYNAEPSLN